MRFTFLSLWYISLPFSAKQQREMTKFKGCILLGLFWLFLFRFRNKGIHSENGILMAEMTGELLRLPSGSQVTGKGDRCGRPRWISRQKFPKRTSILRIPSKPYSVHSENGTAPKKNASPKRTRSKFSGERERMRVNFPFSF